jgi:cell division septal protein FtsQ
VQRPGARRGRAAAKDAGQKGFEWKSALAYAPVVLKAALAVTLGLLAYLGYRTAVSTSFFKVKAVDVAGAARASREEIRSAVLRLSNAGVWQADLELIAKELRGLPWVRDAVVTRVLPDGLRVRVTERAPRVIARNSAGKLVWVDDEGVALGAATPGEQDFFVRGLEDVRPADALAARGAEDAEGRRRRERAEDALRQNRERVRAALELSNYWAASGLTRRVSEVNLEDLRDVRVQLAGEDAAVEVRLGREDFAKRFRQALEVLDAQRLTPRGPFVTYVDVSQGKRAVVGSGPTANYQPASAVTPADAPVADEPAPAAAAPAPSRAARPAPKAAKEAKETKEAAKKPAAGGTPKPAAGRAVAEQKPRFPAVRPRRVDQSAEPEE